MGTASDASSNKRKAAFLGMPHGTAAAKLRKMILWRFIQQCGEDTCFRCKEKIESIDDLSIEHKEPWEGVSVELFWDLDNIAFSHMKCNVPHRYPGGGISKRKIGPSGTAWCIRHRTFHAATEFHSRRRRWNGLQQLCKVAEKERKDRVRGRGREVRHLVVNQADDSSSLFDPAMLS